MIIIYGILIVFTLAVCYLWYKFCIGIGNRLEKRNNPYIKAQKIIDKNNKHYNDYLKWMSKNSNGVPLEKVMSKEEFEAEKKIKKLIS